MNNFKQIYLTHRWGPQIGTNTPKRRGYYDNDMVLHTIQSPEMEPHYQMQLSLIQVFGWVGCIFTSSGDTVSVYKSTSKD